MSDDATSRAGLRPATNAGGSETRPTTAASGDAGPKTTPQPLLARILRGKAWLWILIVALAAYPWTRLLSGDPFANANAAQYLLDHAGTVATAFLVAVLSLTPLRVLFPASGIVRALNRHRRLTGVTAFGFAVLHLGYFWLHVGGWSGVLMEIDKPFIWSGLAAWTVLAVLTITSLNAIVRAMGARGWKRLHRAAYLAAALALYHQAAQQKEGYSESLWFFAPLVLLEIARVIRQRRDAARSSAGL
ncbi:MAG TPA: ferric reductase-like transmembrane domain-containing protein [Opitutaceae bacterium]|nr:ferric reductase-like transmembrane domain-containing protein [Opitutaceae bacterium]